MRTTVLRTAGAVLLTGALLLTTAPSAAAPAPVAPEGGATLLQAVQAWLAFWLRGSAPVPAPEGTSRAAGSESKPGRSASGSEDDPVAQPQTGAEANPDG